MNIFCKLLFVAFALSFSHPLFGDKGSFYPGYIIKKNGSKVTGKIMQTAFIDMEVKIIFLPQGEKLSRKFNATQLQGYAIQMPMKNDVGQTEQVWVYYDSHNVNKPPKIFASKQVFIERELDSPIKLYRYYYEYRADVEHPYRYQYYIQLGDDRLQLVDRDNFIKLTKNLFGAYPALSNRIGQEKFKFENFTRMVRDYVFWLENQHDKNTYRVAITQK